MSISDENTGGEKMEPFDVLNMGNMSDFHLEHSHLHFLGSMLPQYMALFRLFRSFVCFVKKNYCLNDQAHFA